MFWLRQEGTHVSYRQSSIISGGHVVCSSSGSGAAGGARTKAESGSKRTFCANRPTASSSFTIWASICAFRKFATPESAGASCSDRSPAGSSASGKHACQSCRAAASGATAGNSAADSRPGCRTAGHSAPQRATSGNELIVSKRPSSRGLLSRAAHGCLRAGYAGASAQACGRQDRRDG